MKIDWTKYFDAIYCISLDTYIDRRRLLDNELTRVGIKDSGIFRYYYTFKTPFDETLVKNPLFIHPEFDLRFTPAALNLGLGHYNIIKESLGLGYKHILIFEDDIAFLKDLSKMKEILENMPSDYDTILFDKISPSKEDYENCLKYDKKNAYFARYSILWLASCYALSEKGMRHIASSQERKFMVADYYTNAFSPYGSFNRSFTDDINRYFSIQSLACQRPNIESASDHGNKTNSVYKQPNQFDCNINLDDFNI